jgi:hypothetical protein
VTVTEAAAMIAMAVAGEVPAAGNALVEAQVSRPA